MWTSTVFKVQQLIIQTRCKESGFETGWVSFTTSRFEIVFKAEIKFSPSPSLSRRSALTLLPPPSEQATTCSFQFQDYGFWGLWIRISCWLDSRRSLSESSDVLFHEFSSLQALRWDLLLQEIGKFKSVGYFMILVDLFVRNLLLIVNLFSLVLVLFSLSLFEIST